MYESIDVLKIQPLSGFWRPHGDSNPGRLREREVS